MGAQRSLRGTRPENVTRDVWYAFNLVQDGLDSALSGLGAVYKEMMTDHYTIRRESADFLGPRRCQACVSRNHSKCIVNRGSKSCVQCSSELECFMTRNAERMTGTFSWEELIGESASREPLRGGRDDPQPSRGLDESEEILPNLLEFDSRDESYNPLASPEFSGTNYEPYLIDHSSETSSTAARLPRSTTSRQGYGSPTTDDVEESHAPLSAYAVGTGRSHEFPIDESAQRQTYMSRDVPSASGNPLMTSPNRPPSMQDSTSNLDPRMTSSKHDTAGPWPSSNFTSDISLMYNDEMAQSSERARSSVVNEIVEPKAHAFVMENFNATLGSVESRRGKRRGKLSESSASSASKLRTIGACWRCKLQKNQCSADDPCAPCTKSLKSRRYCPPCFRGPLPDLTPCIFWGEDPKPGSTNILNYCKTLHPGARNFLDDAKAHHDDTLDAALKLYESDSGSEMLGLCNIVLCYLETSLSKNKHLSCLEFFSICILDMVSKASEMATKPLSTANDDGDVQGITAKSSDASIARTKAFEVLFGLIKATSAYNPFEAISKATSSKAYNQHRDENHLLSYVESCLFRLTPLLRRPPRDIKNLQIDIPSASDKTRTIVAKNLPDRSASTGGRKRGLSDDSGNSGLESPAASRPRLPATGQEIQDTDESTAEDEG